MQMIIGFQGGPEDYERENAQLQVGRPKDCPNCEKCVGMLALGYYSRWVSSSSRRKVTLITIRRFRCPACHLTTSMLPDFAQPYRLVGTDMVDEYLAGSRGCDVVNVWSEHLVRYQRRFDDRLPETRRVLSAVYGLAELSRVAVDLWEEIRRYFGGARMLTARLAGETRMTVFGLYRCHHPAAKLPVHTSALFPFERGPPFSEDGHDNDLGSSERP